MMKRLLLSAALLFSAGTAWAEADAGLDAIEALGRLNGQALACSQMAASAKAKGLMIRHAPKTRRYGEVFEEATNTAYLAQGENRDNCPSPADLASKLNQLATRLQATFPAAHPGP